MFLQVHMILQRIAFLMLFRQQTMDEIFNSFVSVTLVLDSLEKEGIVKKYLRIANVVPSPTPPDVQLVPSTPLPILHAFPSHHDTILPPPPAMFPAGPQRGRGFGPGGAVEGAQGALPLPIPRGAEANV